MTTVSTAGAVILALHSTASILIFPTDDAFLVTHGSHAWAFGNAADAVQDGEWLSRNTGKPVRVIKDKKK